MKERTRAAVLLAGLALAAMVDAQQPVPAPVSAAAEGIYAAARPSLLQVRTVVEAAGRQSSIGSGFLVTADGLAITNYHVVSQYALEPATYRLEFQRPDGTRGALALLAIDVANDLAVVRLDGSELPHLEFDAHALAGEMPRGERAFAMGNPLDIGFTIVEGTWNGLAERSYNERVHFTAAINPGMSGGPAVTAAGRVAGINVAKRLDGDLVSFLVPADKAAALLERARSQAPLDVARTREEIGRQLITWQDGFHRGIVEQGFRETAFGPYEAPESRADWFDCWAQTNAREQPRPRAQMDRSSCSSNGNLYLMQDLQSGQVDISHTWMRSSELNAFQFAAVVSQHLVTTGRSWSSKRLTAPECREQFVAAADPARAPTLRATWCARAYRDFEGVYDVVLTTVTQDREREALVSRLTMQGFSYDNALDLGRRFLGAIAWKQ